MVENAGLRNAGTKTEETVDFLRELGCKNSSKFQ